MTGVLGIKLGLFPLRYSVTGSLQTCQNSLTVFSLSWKGKLSRKSHKQNCQDSCVQKWRYSWSKFSCLLFVEANYILLTFFIVLYGASKNAPKYTWGSDFRLTDGHSTNLVAQFASAPGLAYSIRTGKKDAVHEQMIAWYIFRFHRPPWKYRKANP